VTHCCIIGGNGFIGSHVADIALSRGRRVTVIDKDPRPERLSQEARYLCGDYGESSFMLKALQGVDEIIDLAYATVPKTSYDDPVGDIFANLPAAVRLLEVASQLPITKIVVVSSGGTVYGSTRDIPISECQPTNPISPYGITKLAIEKYAMMYHQLKNLPVVCVRPANAFGERQRPFSGQGFIATAIAHILKQEEIILFGETGTIRDYIHVSDVASGIIAALDGGIAGSVYNIGTGIGRSNGDVLNIILPFALLAGLSPQVRVMPARGFDVPANVLDSTKLKLETDWEPSVTFETGIQRTWDWFYSELHDLLPPKLRSGEPL
jgi:UDP-glucose 4-epimerase